MKKYFVIVMCILLAACAVKPERTADMAVDFDGVGDGITFTGETWTAQQHSYTAWLIPNATATSRNIAGDDTHSSLGVADLLTGHMYWSYIHGFSTQNGAWTADDYYTPGDLYFVVVTYDASDAANNPVFYINAVVMANTERIIPVGTGEDTVPATSYISAPATSNDAIIYDVKRYDHILSQAEVTELYNNRCKIINDNGLKFHAMLDGAAGLAKFDGSTLATGNTLVDRIGGAVGVPAGNPVGVADTVLMCGGE